MNIFEAYGIGLVVALIAFILINRFAELISRKELEEELNGKDAGGLLGFLFLAWLVWPLTYSIMAIYYTWRLFKLLAFPDRDKEPKKGS